MKKIIAVPLFFVSLLFPARGNSRDFETIKRLVERDQGDQAYIRQLQQEEIKLQERDPQLSNYLNVLYLDIMVDKTGPVDHRSLLSKMVILDLKTPATTHTSLKIHCKFLIAEMLYASSKKLASRYLYQAIWLGRRHHVTDQIVQSSNLLGNLYYDQNNYVLAKKYWLLTLHYAPKKEQLLIASTYNSLGLNERNQGNYFEAMVYYRKAMTTLSKIHEPKNEDLFFTSVVEGNIGEVLLVKKEYAAATPFLLKSYQFLDHHQHRAFTSRQYEEYLMGKINSTESLLTLYQLTHQENELRKLVHFLKTTDTQDLPESQHAIINRILYNYHLQTTDFEGIRTYAQKYKFYQKRNLELLMEQAHINKDIFNSYAISTVKQQNHIKLTKSKKMSDGIILSAGILLLILGLGFFVYYKSYKREQKINLQSQEIERFKTLLHEQQMKNQAEQIFHLESFIKLKMKAEQAFALQLKQLKRKNHANVEEIIKELQFQVSNLIQINKRTTLLHMDGDSKVRLFANHLQEKHPSLTPREIELCLFFMQGLSSKEISNLKNVSPTSIRVYKNKIKHKIGLARGQKLESYLKSIEF